MIDRGKGEREEERKGGMEEGGQGLIHFNSRSGINVHCTLSEAQI